MHTTITAYSDFWSSFTNKRTGKSIPAYPDGYAIIHSQSGHKPPPFPYITYPISFGENVQIMVSIWDKNPAHPGFMGLVADVFAQVAVAIPPQGITLKTDSGLIWLSPAPNFQAFMPDPDNTIVRGVLRLVARGYGRA